MLRILPSLRAVLPAALAVALAASASAQDRPTSHLADLRQRGREPVAFVLEQLERHDLVVFDDALHTLVEPFEFYARLVREPDFRSRARFVFLEAVPLNQQGHIKAYLAASVEDLGSSIQRSRTAWAGRGSRTPRTSTSCGRSTR